MDMPSPSNSKTTAAPGVLTIDLGALRRNYRRIAAMVAPARTAAVVKANAYGLGARRVAPALFDEGCRDFFVAQYGEATALRPLLPREATLYVLNGLQPGEEADCVAQNIIPVLNSLEQIGRWQSAARLARRRLPALLQFDTGMSRLGMSFEEAEALASDEALLDGIDVGMMMSHLACADEAEDPHNALQQQAMRRFTEMFPGIPVSFGNSGGSFLGADFHGALVRPGIALYGGRPSDLIEQPLEPVVRIEAAVVQTRTVAAGTFVGYAASHVTDSERGLATLALGYADGVLRSLSNRGAFYFEGVRLPIVGRVSMDSTIVDISDLPAGTLKLGDLVEWIGPQQSLDEVAEDAGTIAYEILTSIGQRTLRRYR